MKIALLGNMNNNNFALMRYFRDLGADAHLLLHSGDGQGTLEHFSPGKDTWNIERWSSFIHQTRIPNAPVAALDFPLSWFLAYRAGIRTWMGRQDAWVRPVSRGTIRETYSGYDRKLGSGITPAVVNRAGLRLDLFYPYAYEVEFLGTSEFTPLLKPKNSAKAALYRCVARRQAAGIGASRTVLSPDSGDTERVLKAAGAKPRRLAIPMVYAEPAPSDPPNAMLAAAYSAIRGASISILHHARLMWGRTDANGVSAYGRESKNNDWLVRAVEKLSRTHPEANPVLLMVEYGPEVEATKRLAEQIGVGNRVVWLPRMPRRELMWLLSKVSVGSGEFLDIPHMIFGGTGWETLASGRPLLQGFQFGPGEFEEIYGYPPPPMLPVACEADVYRHLATLAASPDRGSEIGRSAKAWFEHHNGIGLAKRWLDILIEPAGGPSGGVGRVDV